MPFSTSAESLRGALINVHSIKIIQPFFPKQQNMKPHIDIITEELVTGDLNWGEIQRWGV